MRHVINKSNFMRFWHEHLCTLIAGTSLTLNSGNGRLPCCCSQVFQTHPLYKYTTLACISEQEGQAKSWPIQHPICAGAQKPMLQVHNRPHWLVLWRPLSTAAYWHARPPPGKASGVMLPLM